MRYHFINCLVLAFFLATFFLIYAAFSFHMLTFHCYLRKTNRPKSYIEFVGPFKSLFSINQLLNKVDWLRTSFQKSDLSKVCSLRTSQINWSTIFRENVASFTGPFYSLTVVPKMQSAVFYSNYTITNDKSNSVVINRQILNVFLLPEKNVCNPYNEVSGKKKDIKSFRILIIFFRFFLFSSKQKHRKNFRRL